MKPITAVRIGAALLILSWLFPPWLSPYYVMQQQVRLVFFGFHFLVTPSSWYPKWEEIDFPRLFLIDLIILTASIWMTAHLYYLQIKRKK